MEPEETKKDFQSTQPYRPAKLPTYIGLFTKKSAISQIKGFTEKGLEQLVNAYKDDKVLASAYEDLKGDSPTTLENIPDPHVTTLFIGGSNAKTKSDCFTSFQPGYKMKVNIIGFAIVPGKIVAGICYPDQSVIKIDNEFPHMTLMKGGWAPKFSNDLIQALCGKEGPLSKEYKKEFKGMENFTYKDQVKVNKGTSTAYLIITAEPLILEVEAKES